MMVALSSICNLPPLGELISQLLGDKATPIRKDIVFQFHVVNVFTAVR
jgi:hypothetical protein